MERMETDAAAVRIVHRLGQEMIEIHEHRGDHDEVGQFPVPPEDHSGDDRRNDEM